MYMRIYTYAAQCLETNEQAGEMDQELLRLHTHTCTYTHTHVCIYIYICTYMWIYTYAAQCLETSEIAGEMDEELLRLLRGYHISAQGLKILDDVGVVVASDSMHINESDLARCGMDPEDRKIVGMISEELRDNIP